MKYEKNAILHTNILKMTWEEVGEELQVKEIKSKEHKRHGHLEMKDCEGPRRKKNRILREKA